ncbi:glycoside hydrolase family 2 TIM barrel-domain containing protein [Algoriphagus sp. CAU 1675]|uniref:glycoside hydrolase family 2 TIM barrel-domain containing protein n=1 Tax=Algoriphagus sp. CAU 1675 TaxID=3032597 RepID=UPI0023DA183D|nr:glycoside hydrolase family 2 TIM barrel-domain containing protein [Algoriphagus sp. CAU 1675]MDF2157772.1 glycoside hydrolase family 2 TIM barrel-domain containing protein [Algoriphagus sp. CAU 1675]
MRVIFLKSFILLGFVFLFDFSAKGQDSSAYRRHYLSGVDAGSPVRWEFEISDGRNKGIHFKIPVPSNWESFGFGTVNYGHDFRDPNKKLGKETGTYRHKFDIPEEWKGKVIKLVFDGAMTDTDVWINGKSAGETHQGGFYRFSYDITDLVKFGKENQLLVKVAKHSSNASVNAAERQADFWIFGGIYRPVFLEVLPANHFTRVAIDAKADGKFKSLITLNEPIENSEIQVELFELGNGSLVGSFSSPVLSDSVWLEYQFDKIKPWNPEKPVLYEAKFSLKNQLGIIYSKVERVGFRTVELKEQDGLYINGTKVFLKGVNRHSFYPTTGRALSEANHLEDILLMKEMNMNAVRMSHYIPDERFLELTDSLGLFVLDEVTGWQDAYDTVIGPKLIQEAILKDANHPSIIAWNHGNEGGWNFANEKGFHQLDIQKRPILYPWLNRNGIDTYHYPAYDPGKRLFNSPYVFMPTEILHGLYDGGLGAGLEDFTNLYRSHSTSAGMFLWAFSDEAFLRWDLGGIYDSDGNHAPDGILGPHREKEGSFYTIKEIWSPVQLKSFELDSNFNGIITLSNEYLYSNLSECSLTWEIVNFKGWENQTLMASKTLSLPSAGPGENRDISLDLPINWKEGDELRIKVNGLNNEELFTWTFPILQPRDLNYRIFAEKFYFPMKKLVVRESTIDFQVNVGDKVFVFSKERGNLELVRVGQRYINFAQGSSEGQKTTFKNFTWKLLKDGAVEFKSFYEPYPKSITWTIFPTGRVKFEASEGEIVSPESQVLGFGFSYPAEKVQHVQWFGNGPYRVWQNRLKGAKFGLWEKANNNTITGYSFDNLIYPEFKGYHADFYAMKLQTEEGTIEISTETPDLYLSLFKPEFPDDSTPGVLPVLPRYDLSFLFKIPPIGTKFHLASEMGPSSQIKSGTDHDGNTLRPITLWFDFQ